MHQLSKTLKNKTVIGLTRVELGGKLIKEYTSLKLLYKR